MLKRNIYILIILSVFVISCGSDNNVDEMLGKWKLIGEKCDVNGNCKKKTKPHIWTFSKQSEDGKLVIFRTSREKPYVFKGRQIFINAAEVIPYKNIKVTEKNLLIRKKMNQYLKLEKIPEDD